MTSTANALENLNQQWKQKGHPYATADEAGWTMTCSSCSLATEEEKVTLVEAMSQAIRHHKKCKETSR